MLMLVLWGQINSLLWPPGALIELYFNIISSVDSTYPFLYKFKHYLALGFIFSYSLTLNNINKLTLIN